MYCELPGAVVAGGDGRRPGGLPHRVGVSDGETRALGDRVVATRGRRGVGVNLDKLDLAGAAGGHHLRLTNAEML